MSDIYNHMSDIYNHMSDILRDHGNKKVPYNVSYSFSYKTELFSVQKNLDPAYNRN